MVGIGVTAKNPNYEDTKSPAHQANLMTAMMVPMFVMMASIFLLIPMAIYDIDVALIVIIGELGFEMLFMSFSPIILMTIGILFVVAGIRSLASPE